MKVFSSSCTTFAIAAFSLLLATAPSRAAAQAPVDSKIIQQRKSADRFFQAGKTEEAKTIYLGIASSYPDDFLLNKNLGDCFFAGSRREFAQAARYYGRAYQLNPKDAAVEKNLAKSYSWSQQYKTAIPMFQRIIARDPSDPEALLELARAQNYSGQRDAARQTYEIYVKRWSKDREVRTEYAALLNSLQQFDAALEQYRIVLRIDPNNFRARLGEADVLSSQGKLQDSLNGYDRILRNSPGRYEVLLGRAFVLLRMQSYDEAEQAFAAANRIRPPGSDVKEALNVIASGKAGQPVQRALDEVNALNREADEAAARNDFATTVDRLRQLTARTPQDSALRLRLGRAYLWNRQWDEAIGVFQQLYAEHPDDLAALEAVGDTQMDANRMTEAARTFAAYLQHSSSSAVRLKLGQCLVLAGKFDEAIPVFQQILQRDKDNFAAKLGLAQALSRNGKIDEGQQLFESLLAEKPANREALLGKAQTLYWSGNIESSLEVLEGLRSAFPTDPEIASVLQWVRDAENPNAAATPERIAEADQQLRKNQETLAGNPNDVIAMQAIGDLFLLKGDYGNALSTFEKLLVRQPNDTAVRVKLAQAASLNRDYRRSITLYQALLAEESDNRDFRFELGKVLGWAGRNKESIAQFRELLQRNPGDLVSRVALARVLGWNLQFDEALQECDRVLKNDGRNRDALLERAQVLSWKGELDAAVKIYDTLLDRNPQDHDATVGRSQVLLWASRSSKAR